MYTELEQFLHRGEEKVLWVLSIKNIMGLLGGGVVGHRLGAVLLGAGLGVLLCMLLGAIVGIALTFQYHGLLIARRLVMRLRFYLRRAIRPQTLDAEAIFAIGAPPEAVPIQVFLHDGTPVLVPEWEGRR